MTHEEKVDRIVVTIGVITLMTAAYMLVGFWGVVLVAGWRIAK